MAGVKAGLCFQRGKVQLSLFRSEAGPPAWGRCPPASFATPHHKAVKRHQLLVMPSAGLSQRGDCTEQVLSLALRAGLCYHYLTVNSGLEPERSTRAPAAKSSGISGKSVDADTLFASRKYPCHFVDGLQAAAKPRRPLVPGSPFVLSPPRMETRKGGGPSCIISPFFSSSSSRSLRTTESKPRLSQGPAAEST